MGTDVTPVKPHTGSIQNYSAAGRASSGDSRAAYQQDLLGNIEYRSQKPINAYATWSITSIDTVVKTIEESIRAGNDLNEFQQNVWDKVEEKYLYPQLQSIFRTIEGAVATKTGYDRSQYRQLVAMGDHVPDAEKMAFPINKPDFALVEVPPTSEPLTPSIDPGSNRVKWREICGFVEVKNTFNKGPNAPSATTVRQIVSQGANYARLILASRPFHLYVLCIFIYGPNFCLGWYDRRGVILSDDYHIDTDLGILINVVLQLTTHMTSCQLGHDKTATLLNGHTYYQKHYPSFLVSMSTATDTRRWKTMGAPIWSSMSLLGRGTATWRAESLQDGETVVLKTLWRSQTRQSESDVYRLITSDLPGVATLSLGDDVRHSIGRDANAVVTVGWLRSTILRDDAHVRDDPVLHRLTLKTIGRPLWDAEMSETFITGSLAALKGHEALWIDKGILHRDMSPGNIFIGQLGCAEGWEGFVADLELAWIAQAKTEKIDLLEHVTPSVGQKNTRGIFHKETVSNSRTPGAEITGTTLFMAGELLDKMLPVDKKDKGKVCPAHLERGVHHDLESFILVLFYAVMKRTLGKRFSEEDAFNRSGIERLYRSLFHGCWMLLKSQRADSVSGDAYTDEIEQELQLTSEKPRLITYDQLYTTYGVALNTLSELPE
ncbi:hypothetical protein DFJ58DRAFT_736804 [Suillus subalutaceus]|uniref:uncharacterized protein n=1 Tax=Suillus subalutaceus TaxID=48586 RepID=UPI001B8606B4|nr:uncharacterized protein DFJ58DRAFT_736804 [Suillus subalutaceus]KAG1830949.1 hypothetical protein DFJ58DRAFT_736804 [Suillus subalutaceus]